MTHDDIYQISRIVGLDHVSTNALDLICHAEDLAPIPKELLHAYGAVPPELVVIPRTLEEVSKVVAYAYRQRIPITPRGAATTALGGTVPVEGGIVLDLCALKEIVEFDGDDEYIIVQAGIDWKRVFDFVEKRGFQLGAHPSSAVSATVGGYIGIGGSAGIGVPKYGPIGEQILGMRVVLADGTIRRTGPFDSWLFIGSEGTLGLICEVTLKVFRKSKRRFFAFGFDTTDAGVEAVDRLYRLRPYFLSCINRGLVRMLNEVGVHLVEKDFTVVLTLDGNEEELEKKVSAVREICRDALWYPEHVAEEEWENRHKVGLAFKTLGPSLFVQELRTPIRTLKATLTNLENLLENEEWGIESLQSDSGAICLVVYILADERCRVEFLRKFSYAAKASDIAFRNGGAVFTVGLHNAPHMQRMHGRSFELMRAIKDSLDPAGILNPSKVTEVRIPPLMLNSSMKMMGLVPEVMLFGLETVAYVPQSLIRFGLKFVGEGVR